MTTCGYVGCRKRATRRLRAKYARAWWLGCNAHHPAMRSALTVGQGSAGELHDEPIGRAA